MTVWQWLLKSWQSGQQIKPVGMREEDFVVILPDTDLQGGLEVSEKIRKAIF